MYPAPTPISYLTCPCPVLPDIAKTTDMEETAYQAPGSVLIIGSGVFGLSTAWALTKRPEFASTTITVLDRSPEPGVFPARDAASVDSSRIVRTDYANPAYAALAAEAAVHWRQTGDDELGGQGRYSRSGLLLGANDGPLVRPDGAATGIAYAKKSWVNAMALGQTQGYPLASIRMVAGRRNVARMSGTGGGFADWAYLNENSGWADAEAAMQWTYERVVKTGRVTFVNGTAERLETDAEGKRVTGAKLKDGSVLSADLVILAAGAWTSSLVDLSSQVVATGQAMAYLELTEEEQKKLQNMPVMLNLSDGLFIIPPKNRVLKIGRHSYGYLNPTPVPAPLGGAKGSADGPESNGDTFSPPAVTISQPFTHLDDPTLAIPPEGEEDLRRGLKSMIPWPELQDRQFSRTRLCWYTDTATGDWIIDYHPRFHGLFVATGGSGHGFKFLPVLGEKIAGCIMGVYPKEFKDKWRWKTDSNAGKAVVREDGSRGGKPGLILRDVLRRGESEK
ncbi:hypothetical protein DL767_006121 [Monosporascus sp. MG133]|nr:hypothetical protein DL767_006121 [Monosporascus sp. MG133]